MKRRIVALPNERTLHAGAIPRGGGIVIATTWLAFLAAYFLDGQIARGNFLALFVGGGLMALLGVLDDIIKLKALPKFLAQVIAVVLGLYWIGGVPAVALSTGVVDLGLAGTLLGVVALLWGINLYNFMDGIDGMAGSGAIFISVTMGVFLSLRGQTGFGALCSLLAAACAGFIWFNWPPARLFMGDAGSGFLGYVFGLLLFATAREVPACLWLWLITMAYFITDTTTTLLLRVRYVKKFYGTHRFHAYQSLARRTGSHARVTGGVLLIELCWLLPLAIAAWDSGLRPLGCSLWRSRGSPSFARFKARCIDSRLGVAVWGLGRHATRRVLPALAESSSVRIAGICTRNDQRGRAEAARYSCAYFSSPELMLRDSRIDVVYVATPAGLHFAQGLSVLEADKHLWCEKPMTHSHATTCQLFDTAAHKGLMAANGFMYKYHPQFAAIKRILAERTIGELLEISIRFGLPQLGTPSFRDDPDLGGGALLDVGCYSLSVAYQLLAEPPELKSARVVAAPPSRVDTDGWAVLQGETLVDSVWGMGRAYQNYLRVWGSRGVLVADRVFTKEDDYESTVLVYDERGGPPAVVGSGQGNSHRAMVDAFANQEHRSRRDSSLRSVAKRSGAH